MFYKVLIATIQRILLDIKAIDLALYANRLCQKLCVVTIADRGINGYITGSESFTDQLMGAFDE